MFSYKTKSFNKILRYNQFCKKKKSNTYNKPHRIKIFIAYSLVIYKLY